MVRSRRLAWLMVLAGMALAGCEPWHRLNARSDDELKYAGIDSADPSLERPDELKGFFSGTNSGGWSREARSIENSLGAY